MHHPFRRAPGWPAALIACAPLALPAIASANPFPNTGDLTVADNGVHTYCYTSAFTTDQSVASVRDGRARRHHRHVRPVPGRRPRPAPTWRPTSGGGRATCRPAPAARASAGWSRRTGSAPRRTSSSTTRSSTSATTTGRTDARPRCTSSGTASGPGPRHDQRDEKRPDPGHVDHLAPLQPARPRPHQCVLLGDLDPMRANFLRRTLAAALLAVAGCGIQHQGPNPPRRSGSPRSPAAASRSTTHRSRPPSKPSPKAIWSSTAPSPT